MVGPASGGLEQRFHQSLAANGVENERLFALQIVDFVPQIGVDHRLRIFQVFENGATAVTLLQEIAFHLERRGMTRSARGQ